MTIVVTGAAGFIGAALVRHLTHLGHPVVAIDRRPVCSGPQVRTILGDLNADVPDIRDALGEAECVYHLAACPGVRDVGADVAQRRYRDNVVAAENVLRMVRPSATVVVTSSSSVYGGVTLGRASRESDPLHPCGGYARSKAVMEEVCATWRDKGRLVIVARPFTVVGEGQRPDMALSLWTRAVLRDEPIRVFGSLDRTRDLTDVRDVNAALTALARLGRPTTVNIGSGRARSLAEIIEVVGEVCGRTPRVRVEPPDAAEVVDTCADVSHLHDLVGFTPETDLADVVRRVVGRG